MGFIRRSCFIVFAILLCAWASRSSDEKRTTEEVLLSQLVDPASGEIDGYLVRKLYNLFCLNVISIIY